MGIRARVQVLSVYVSGHGVAKIGALEVQGFGFSGLEIGPVMMGTGCALYLLTVDPKLEKQHPLTILKVLTLYFLHLAFGSTLPACGRPFLLQAEAPKKAPVICKAAGTALYIMS